MSTEYDQITTGRQSGPTQLTVDEVLHDLRAGMRTKGFLLKYGITLAEFESLLRMLIKKGVFTKQEYQTWKEQRPRETKQTGADSSGYTQVKPSIETFVLNDPEKNHAWALQLFSTKRESIPGATFKVILQGKKYLFVVEELIFRGQVCILEGEKEDDKNKDVKPGKDKREEALQFIAKYGWAAYLEQRAFEANFAESKKTPSERKARMVLIHCKHNTYLAAVHTPTPAINLYVGTSLDNLKSRLSKVMDISQIDILR